MNLVPKHLVANPIGQVADQFADRLLNVLPFPHVDLDGTTLAKQGHAQSLNRLAIACGGTMIGWHTGLAISLSPCGRGDASSQRSLSWTRFGKLKPSRWSARGLRHTGHYESNHVLSTADIISLPVSNLYDYNESTEANYEAVSPADGQSVGEFKDLRNTMDYNYHRRYSAARQLVQDEIMRGMLVTVVQDSTTNMFCERPQEPWVVFTAGAMGVGKSHCMRWLSHKGLFPLPSFVHVNPDEVRYMLPEMAGYMARDPTSAGAHTQKEAGFLQEILTLEGLRYGKNVLVDGSLRNVEWYAGFFERIRKEYPRRKIAIIHIVAETSKVVSRAARRAEITGRHVPRDVLLDAIEQVPKSFAKLAPLTDYSVSINNDGSEPVLISGNGTWDAFSAHWDQSCKDGESIPSWYPKGFANTIWTSSSTNLRVESASKTWIPK